MQHISKGAEERKHRTEDAGRLLNNCTGEEVAHNLEAKQLLRGVATVIVEGVSKKLVGCTGAVVY